ncbi:hypothetical protein H4V95_002541 [Arthrobacter sp. CAN_C5]|nr:hypothetical protein [Arthrobacter sp. CAN_C5]
MGNKKVAAAGRKQIYVETLIGASLEEVWDLSQNPEQHPRWDLRFSSIVPVSTDDQKVTHFRYAFNLPFYTIAGMGVSLGHRFRADGQATSVLKFSTANPLSPIRKGSGYWRYIPTDRGTRFITGYTYDPGMGLVGRLLDSGFIRPALVWATAVSFDRLRLWAEAGQDPAMARTRWILDGVARTAALIGAATSLRRALFQPCRHRILHLAFSSAAIAAVTLLPAHQTVPRARRCLRRPLVKEGASAPPTLVTLPTPLGIPSKYGQMKENRA